VFSEILDVQTSGQKQQLAGVASGIKALEAFEYAIL
jgi:hypothetical protein